MFETLSDANPVGLVGDLFFKRIEVMLMVDDLNMRQRLGALPGGTRRQRVI